MTSCAPIGSYWRRSLCAVTIVLAAVGLGVCMVLFAQVGSELRRPGAIEYEVTSDYSHIRVRRAGDIRTLVFVADSGEELIESRVDLRQPQRLLLPYTRSMFASYLFAPQPERALVVGLGGGGMVHFLKSFDPDLRVDVLEIDPVVIAIAADYFHVRSDGNLRIIQQDAREFLRRASEVYDVIYMDAFLDTSEATDSTGVPLHLKTREFLDQLRARLTAEGLVVFNLHQNAKFEQDVATIRAAFAQVYVFRVPARGNVIVAASMAPTRLDRPALRQRAADLDRTSPAGFPFARLADNFEK